MGERPSVTKLKNQERLEKALALRRGGATYQQIADSDDGHGGKLYSSRQAAFTAINRELKKLTQQNEQKLEECRALELERLEHLTRSLWPDATDRQHPMLRNPAIDRFLRVSERRCKLLGLDAAQRMELTGEGGGPVEANVSVTFYIPDNGRDSGNE